MNLARSIETRCLYALTLCALLAANVPAAAQYDRTVEGTRKALMALVDRMKNMEETESGQALEDEEAEQGGEWRLRSSADAEAKAIAVFGVGARAACGSDAKLTVLEVDNTPFLSGAVVGRPVWVVTLHGAELRLVPEGQQAGRPHKRTFDIAFDAERGHLIRIQSHWPKGVPNLLLPPASAASATEQFRRAGRQRYHRFLEDIPPVTFLDALGEIYRNGIGNPLSAPDISGQYVEASVMGREAKPTWAITLRGITPLKETKGTCIHALNHMRYSVDAQTGRWLRAGTSPQPDEIAARQFGDDKPEIYRRFDTPALQEPPPEN